MAETYLPLPDVAERLGVKYTRVRQFVADHKLLAIRDKRGIMCVAESQLITDDDGTRMVKDLRGTVLTLLDGGFSEAGAEHWLMTRHDALGARPIDLLREGAHKKVNRQAIAEAL